jgi:hypothetical protein
MISCLRAGPGSFGLQTQVDPAILLGQPPVIHSPNLNI